MYARETENPALLGIEYSNHGEKKERKKEKLLRRINETGGGIPVDEERRRRGEGGARMLEGERARKRGLQEFNLDEFFLATYYRMGSRETLVWTSLERPSVVTTLA